MSIFDREFKLSEEIARYHELGEDPGESLKKIGYAFQNMNLELLSTR